MSFRQMLKDPALGGTSFKVVRSFFRKERGRTALDHREQWPMRGCIQSAGPEENVLFPEGVKTDDLIVILAQFDFSLGERETGESLMSAADEILWQGRRYRVIRTRDWHREGEYEKAWAVILKEDEQDNEHGNAE